MRSFITTIMLILFSFMGFSQTQNNQSAIKKINKGETYKVVLDMSSYNLNNVTKFKDELTSQKDQIDIVHYNDIDKIFTFIYNDKINVEKIETIFNKNGISHIESNNVQLFKN